VGPSDPGQGPLATAGETVEGTFLVKWGDPPAGLPILELSVMDDRGVEHKLAVDEGTLRAHGGPLELDKKRVRVTGTKGADEVLRVESLDRTGGGLQTSDAQAAVVSGSQPHVSILCRFSDIASTPVTVGYVQGLTGGTQPGLDHYWRELSRNQVDILGSQVVGWFTLPQPRSFYVSGGNARLNELARDCAAVADAAVNFPSFVGVNFLFNANLDCCAWGGSTVLSLDGAIGRTYRATWLPPWGYQNQSVLAHEMGHGFGLPHSSGDYGATYDSKWDVMSGGDGPVQAPYGTIGTNTIGYHLHHKLGWIAADRAFTAGAGTSTIVLERTDQPPATGYLLAIVPIAGTPDEFFTVEARRFVGYDSGVPLEGIVIHRVDPNRPDGRPAHVMDGDLDGDPNDAGAAWVPGETFQHAASGISIEVDAVSGTGWQVTITRGSGGGGGTPPAAPSILPATAVSTTSILVPWQDLSTDETSFEVYRKSGKTFTRIATTGANATSHQDTGLTPGATYSYYVRACNAAGCSANSAITSATTSTGGGGGGGAPSAPGGLTAAPGATGAIDLDWTDQSGNETEFRVEQRNAKTAFTRIATLGANVTSYSSTGLRRGIAYTYRVQACNAAGCSAYSPTATATAP
jgi:M6 family metalloprotease-like protein